MELVKYNIETAVITALAVKYADVKVVDGKSKEFAMAGLAEYRELRLKIDAKHKELKADALIYGRAVDAEKNRLKGLLEPGEQHLKDARQVYDDKIAAKKTEKDRIEQERIDTILSKIADIEKVPSTTVSMNSEMVASRCDFYVGIQITEEEYQEFTEKAKQVKLATLSALDDIYNDKVIQEKESAERKAEIEKIEKLRAEQAEAQAKIDKEKAAFEAEKRAEQEKQDRTEFERKAQEQAKAQAKRQAEQEVQMKEKERIEAEREAKRQADLLPDKEKIIAFADMLVDLKLPVVKSQAAKLIMAEVNAQLDDLQSLIRSQAEMM